MIDLATIVRDAIEKALKNQADEFCVDFPQSTKWLDQTTVIVSEQSHTLLGEYEEYEVQNHVLWQTTLEINVLAKDRTKARDICLAATKAGLAVLKSLIDRNDGPILGVTQGGKECGPAMMGNVYLKATNAKRFIIVTNMIE